MPPGHPIPPRPLSGVGLGSKPSKVGTGTQTGIRICGLQVRPLSRLGQSDPEPLGVTATEGSVHSRPTFLQSQDLYVTNRYPDSNRKAGTPGTSPHEANPVASQKTLEGSRISGKRDSSPKVSSPEPTMVDQGDQCLTRSTSAPLASCHSNIYSRLKRRLGCSLRRLYNKRCLVSARKPPSHKFPRTEGGLAGLEKVPAPSARKGGANCYRQHHSCGIHQQGGRYEVRLTLCPSLAAPVLVQSETGCSKGQAHSWLSKCDCRQVVTTGQIIQTEWSLHQEVFNLLVQAWHLPLVDMFATKYNCTLAQYVSPVPDPNAWAVDALTVSWDNLDMYVFPPVSLLGKVVSKLSDHLYKRVILIPPGWPNMP